MEMFMERAPFDVFIHRGHELSADSRKAELNTSDLDKQSEPRQGQLSFFKSLHDLLWTVKVQVEASGA